MIRSAFFLVNKSVQIFQKIRKNTRNLTIFLGKHSQTFSAPPLSPASCNLIKINDRNHKNQKESGHAKKRCQQKGSCIHSGKHQKTIMQTNLLQNIYNHQAHHTPKYHIHQPVCPRFHTKCLPFRLRQLLPPHLICSNVCLSVSCYDFFKENVQTLCINGFFRDYT